jgi:hypothetical protein
MADVLAALDGALDPRAQRPCLAADVDLARFVSRWHGRHAVLHNPRAHTYVRLGGHEAEVVDAMDGTRTVGEITVAGLQEGALDPDMVADLVGYLHRGGFLTRAWVDTTALLAARTTPPATRLLDPVWRRMRTIQTPAGQLGALAVAAAGVGQACEVVEERGHVVALAAFVVLDQAHRPRVMDLGVVEPAGELARHPEPVQEAR